MQLELFEDEYDGKISLEELFEAYFECRKNKRRTVNALAFEVDYESKLIELWQDINSGNYQLGRSIAFMVEKPVYREVFAADFRDRIVHHLIIRKLNHLFEQEFIEDSYSCREGKGTLFGVKRIECFIKQCSQNYAKDCYILKMDIQSFFMSIDKEKLFKMLRDFIVARYFEEDRNIIINLVHKIIFNRPEKNCLIKGKKSNWDYLPMSKSLFYAGKSKGQPIGNLTSQVFANFYLDVFDKFVKDECGVKYYGRYVDDFVVVHEDKAFLLELKKKMEIFIYTRLGLKLHPRKFYLQHYAKGVKFVGAVIKPYRIYTGKRTKGNFYAKIAGFNEAYNEENTVRRKLAVDVVSSINSYLGFMIHYKSFCVRTRALQDMLQPVWQKYIGLSADMRKILLRKFYKPRVIKIKNIRSKKSSKKR